MTWRFYASEVAKLWSFRQFVIVLSVLFTAFYFPLINWSVILGTEVSLLSMLLTWAALIGLRIIKTKTFSPFLFVVFGIGTLVRMDFLVPAIALTLCLLLLDPTNRKKHVLIGIPLLLSFLVLQTLFRLWYYHDIFPNTYYLKTTGYPLMLRMLTGAYVGLKAMNWILVLVPFVYAYLTRNKSVSVLLSCFTAVALYSVYVGGDAWEQYGGANRYVAVAMPLFFLSFVVAIYSLRSVVRQHSARFFRRYRATEVLLLLFCFLVFNAGADNTLLELLLLKAPLTVGENAFQVNMAESLNRVTTPDAKIGIVWAGITPYFSRREYVDLLGKSDKVIAREQAHYDNQAGPLRRLLDYKPGHNKWDYPYVVRRYKPDIFGQIFPSDAKKYLVANYEDVLSFDGHVYFVLKGTKNVHRSLLLPYH